MKVGNNAWHSAKSTTTYITIPIVLALVIITMNLVITSYMI